MTLVSGEAHTVGMMPRGTDTQVRERVRAWLVYFRGLYYMDKPDAQLAKDLGMTGAAISMILSRKRPPGLDTILAIRRVFGVTADQMLSVDPPPLPGANNPKSRR